MDTCIGPLAYLSYFSNNLLDCLPASLFLSSFPQVHGYPGVLHNRTNGQKPKKKNVLLIKGEKKKKRKKEAGSHHCSGRTPGWCVAFELQCSLTRLLMCLSHTVLTKGGVAAGRASGA